MLGFSTFVFLFTVYSFFGWLIENVYSLVTSRVFFKPNLFFGPFKPMYGFAPILLILFISEDTPLAAVLVLCFTIPTLIEYISGVLLHRFFGRRWWDYSHLPFQIQGHICLPFSLCWLVLSFFCINVINLYMLTLFHSMETYWTWLWPIVLLYFFTEMLVSFRRQRVLMPTT